MKILITGATGLVGNALVRLLLSKNHSVNYLTTSISKIENLPDYKGFYWNPEQGKIDENCLYEVDAIIHLAGANIAHRWTKAYKQEIIESRTLSAELLYNLVRKVPNQVKHFISASGTAIYPDSITTVYDETTKETENSFLSSVVQKWEESADRFKVLGMKTCKIRTGVVLSAKGGALPQMMKPIKMGFGAALGSGKQVQSWIHLDDLTALYLFVLENQLEGVFNAVSPNPVSNMELTKAIASALKKPLWLPNVPEFVIKIMLGEMSYLLFASNNLSSRKIQDLGFQFKHPEIKEAVNTLLK